MEKVESMENTKDYRSSLPGVKRFKFVVTETRECTLVAEGKTKEDANRRISEWLCEDYSKREPWLKARLNDNPRGRTFKFDSEIPDGGFDPVDVPYKLKQVKRWAIKRVTDNGKTITHRICQTLEDALKALKMDVAWKNVEACNFSTVTPYVRYTNGVVFRIEEIIQEV